MRGEQVEAPIRVAVVDDSRSIRAWLRHIFDEDPRMTVVGEAGSGIEARDLLRHTGVDVLTLDVDMPHMSGIDFLERLMLHRPMPVVMLSAITEEGSEAAVRALSLGAVDCIEKPRSALQPNIASEIRERVYQAAHVRVHRAHRMEMPKPAPLQVSCDAAWTGGVILLGASTGGVAALEALLREIDNCACPVVIAQHMPDHFLDSFSKRLSRSFNRDFALAEDGTILRPGQGFLAVGKETSTRLHRTASGMIRCQVSEPSPGTTFRPSIDDLFYSAAEAGLGGAAALLTGLGRDGAEGLLALRNIGMRTFSQDEGSSVVYGMPRAAADLGAADEILNPQEIGRALAAIAPKFASGYGMQ